MSDVPKFKTFRDLRSIPSQSAKEATAYTSISSTSSITSTSSNTSAPDAAGKTSLAKEQNLNALLPAEIAPVRDFQKVPNSVTRAVMAQGVFRGKSKQVWDYLWSMSRGAMNPTRIIRKSRKEIKEGAGLGSMVTVDSAIEHLIQTGLIKVNRSVGSLSGNEYEIFTPEEAARYTSISSTSSNTSPIQNLVYLDIPESSNTSTTQIVENATGYGDPKTSFKTLSYIDDDAPVISVLEKLNKTARKLTGKDLTKKDLERLSDLTELLISETVIAAARTDSISSTISFMTENLRRRLYSKPREKGKKEKRSGHLNIGKGSDNPNSEETSWSPQTPLTGEQRENTLKALREAKLADSMLFREFKTYGEIEYTPEDFKWFMDNLERGNNE
jgi:hypothetical protein